jgi:transcriptional regulator
MYIPPHFAITDPQVLYRIMRDHPLGVLVTSAAGGLDANHIPFEFDPSAGKLGVLTGHVARTNPVWQQCLQGAEVMVIFRGDETYISPNWYPSKHETHRQVPTWNYEVVHVFGRLSVRDDEKFMRGVVARLTRTHEAQEPKPWKMGDSAPDYIDGMLKAIVGIEITIERFEGKSKLSQNRESRDLQGAIDKLREQGKTSIAQAMEKPTQR